MISRISALVDAFAKLNGALDPQSDAYKLRNPLLLKAFSPKHDRDDKGRRRFRSFTSGYDNGILDVQIKCSGKSYSKSVGPDTPLTSLVCLYGNPISATRYVVNFLRHALEDDTITENIPLGWFLEVPATTEIRENTNGI